MNNKYKKWMKFILLPHVIIVIFFRTYDNYFLGRRIYWSLLHYNQIKSIRLA